MERWRCTWTSDKRASITAREHQCTFSPMCSHHAACEVVYSSITIDENSSVRRRVPDLHHLK